MRERDARSGRYRLLAPARSYPARYRRRLVEQSFRLLYTILLPEILYHDATSTIIEKVAADTSLSLVCDAESRKFSAEKLAKNRLFHCIRYRFYTRLQNGQSCAFDGEVSPVGSSPITQPPSTLTLRSNVIVWPAMKGRLLILVPVRMSNVLRVTLLPQIRLSCR